MSPSNVQSDGEKSDQDLVVDDASEGPSSPVPNGATSPRENGLDKASSIVVPSMSVQTVMKKDIPPHSPRSGTSSNASTPSAKKMEEREKTTTPISKSLTPTSVAVIGVKSSSSSSSSTSGKLLQGPPLPPGAVPPPAAAYPALHYPGPPPPHNLAPAATGQHPHVDMMGYNGYPVPRPPATLQQLYDPHAAMRAPVGSVGIPGGKP